MSDKPERGNSEKRPGFFSRFLGRTPVPGRKDPGASITRIAHYEIRGTLGEGGMGVVYIAQDARLKRVVALKMMTSLAGDESARRRFWREARAAASVNHPNVCQLYEIGEERGELFLAMELLEGEPLSARLARGAMPISDAISVTLGILAALGALHARGIVHRDLKPSNVFLTPHGVKILDFGLARSGPSDGLALDSMTDVTRSGVVVGTPRYMAPEQALGQPMDGRADLFAAGAMLFEMLAGRPAFDGKNVVEVMHATLHEQPPALTGSPAIAATDRVIRRALAKSAADRPASADDMARELRAVGTSFGDETPAMARTLKRLVVLPFRVLRPDPETDFLAFSLPDAIATSLTRFDSLIVRSSATAARFDREAPDLKAIAAEADVDRVVMGTVLRSGDHLRATAQLVEAPGGTLLSSQSVEASLGDLFRLQDDIASRVVEALSLPLVGAAAPSLSVPHDARAYELYLRANELARVYNRLPQARDLYRQSLELDSRFAPAWAQLGRSIRVVAKFIDAKADPLSAAEDAFRRALDLNPRLSVAHKYYAAFEADAGRSHNAMMRLLEEANRHGNDPELFAGLVHACRYVGLNAASLAAHAEARRLDPNVPSSYGQTLLLNLEADRLIQEKPAAVSEGDTVIRIAAMGLMGHVDDARVMLKEVLASTTIRAFVAWAEFQVAWLDRSLERMEATRAGLANVMIMEDPEAIFMQAWLFCDVGDTAGGLALLQQSVARGYYPCRVLAADKAFDPLRKEPAFQALVADADAGRRKALAAYREAGGERLLGV